MNEQSKIKRYERVYEQIKELIQATTNPVSRMATINAILQHKFSYYYWTGFYELIEGELLVGAYQGPVACLKLKKDTGVCWAGINSGETVVVDNVHDFPGHIACSSASNSEIVVPVFDKEKRVVAVLDVDSKEYSAFDQADKAGLEKIVALIYG
ncbi:GAF domain-containing protein [Carboxylicivirga sediminis]|uniref:GAF domain-containing protein n=1 Tax=Carboxylicivirga sediminis TaxID=2006564 RepID=A0A941IXU0_9BACT|nr:GAF domain-containing protein [Carboxylicivirga sediminis]MBR8537196.1 GAF domain-containing protein [Carboxylicivirga sediminis]